MASIVEKPKPEDAPSLLAQLGRFVLTQKADLGHTRERHIGKSDNWLKQRLADDPNMNNASTFFNEAGANRAQGLLVKKHKLDIDRWLQGRDSQLTFSFDAGSVVGSVLERGKPRS